MKYISKFHSWISLLCRLEICTRTFLECKIFNQDELLKLSKDAFDFPLDKVSFNLLEKKLDRISLSWHLTRQEREKVQKAFFSKENQQSLKVLEGLLE